MTKSSFIPHADHDFSIWLDQFISKLSPELGLTEIDLATLQKAKDDFQSKSAYASETAAMAKQATANKNDSRRATETLVRAEVRRIKARSDYTQGKGAHLGIIGPDHRLDLSTYSPDLIGTDQTGGFVSLSFTKNKSNGINIYCQRENDTDWILIGRATVSPYIDSRTLLQTGKPELRRYTAIYILKDMEVGHYSDEIVVTCGP